MPVTIADLIPADRVIVPLRANDKPHLLRELARRAGQELAIDPHTILAALETRERFGSTGTGQGIALPHARIAGLPASFGMFAKLERPIDFDAIDGRPVDLVFMLLTPDRPGNDHLAALAAVARGLRGGTVAARLRQATTSAQAYELLAHAG
jgi:PTS system nitrogen regulatory IIA component